MRRGSTPTNTFTVPIDLTTATVYIDYEQDNGIVIEKTNSDMTIESDKITIELTQEDTLKFKPGFVYIQLRYVFPNGAADASNIIRATFDRIIKDGVIEYV